MVNHTIHTCEQRVRFPLSAIVLFIHYITTILYSTPHIHKPTHIYSPDPKQKPHHHYIYYYISVSILHSNKTKTISSSSLTILTTTSYQIYILSYLLLIIIYYYYYIYTNLQSNTPLSQNIYLTYTIITYLLTLKYRTHLSIHLFHPTIVFIHIHTLTFILLYI